MFGIGRPIASRASSSSCGCANGAILISTPVLPSSRRCRSSMIGCCFGTAIAHIPAVISARAVRDRFIHLALGQRAAMSAADSADQPAAANRRGRNRGWLRPWCGECSSDRAAGSHRRCRPHRPETALRRRSGRRCSTPPIDPAGREPCENDTNRPCRPFLNEGGRLDRSAGCTYSSQPLAASSLRVAAVVTANHGRNAVVQTIGFGARHLFHGAFQARQGAHIDHAVVGPRFNRRGDDQGEESRAAGACQPGSSIPRVVSNM